MDVFNRHAGLDLAAPHSRKTLEEEVVCCSTYLVALKSRLNTLTPISVLPPEVLCEVFLHVAGVGDRDNGIGSHSYGWICITHVCKHWRAVALSCPSLWSKLTVTRQRPWMTELLARSKRAPLYVTATLPRFLPVRFGPPLDSPLATVLEHLARIRSLSITNQNSLTSQIVQLLDKPAPLLESLVIRNQAATSYVPLDTCEHIHAMLHRPENSRLRRLELYSIPLPWDRVSLPNLTHLTISRRSQYLEMDMGIAAQALINAIASMGCLEELVVDGALDSYSHSPETKASLPRLKRLRTVGSTTGCIALLNCLETPSLSRLAVITGGRMEPWCTELLNAVAGKTQSLGAFLCLSLACLHLSGESIRLSLCAYSRYLDPSLSPPTLLDSQGHDPELFLSINHAEVNVLLDDVCKILPIRDIHQLTVSARSLQLSTWTTLFKCTRKVTELTISACASHETFPDALLHRTRAPKKSGAQPVFHYVLPQLRALTLTHCYFNRYVDDNFGLPLLVDTSLTSRLLDCFTERYEYGAEIEALHLVRTINIAEEEVDWLKHTVRVVEWDGFLDADDEVGSTDIWSDDSLDLDSSDASLDDGWPEF
ncbi:hypothetical protein FOMPIDRAFT_1063054 [Fomitopsis schrenkii]|uniref:F-box domain-containing protein n=1 Tax=Fomitopsis schrenkii TaxID=2126942 RepID=S8DU56_FOMSC|nr:hypothetical protein FOMPIDRAFT_1063054 [Fomitopsis schrenkii]